MRAIASIGLTTVLLLLFCPGVPILQWLNPLYPWGDWIPISASIPIVAGAGAIVKRRRFWWLGLAGATISAALLAQWIWFVLTFKGKGW